MGRQLKVGLDYFSLDVGLFSDKKIKSLRAHFGADGIAFYLYILCEVYKDQGYYVQADADILLRYTESVSVKKDILYEEKCYSGRQKKMFMVGINDREWNLGLGRIPYGEYDISGEKKQVRLLDRLYLPVFYGSKTVQEYEMVQRNHTEEEMNALMQEEWRKIITTLEEKGVQITEKNVTIKKTDADWVLHARMELEEAAVQTAPSKTVAEEETSTEEGEQPAEEGQQATEEQPAEE